MDDNNNLPADGKSVKENARVREQSRESEKVSHIGPYLSRINSAYQRCKDGIFKEGQYTLLDPKGLKTFESSVERAFDLPKGSFANLQAIAKPAKILTGTLDPIGKTLETYAQEGCLICSAHHVGYFLLLHTPLLTFVCSVSHPWKI